MKIKAAFSIPVLLAAMACGDNLPAATDDPMIPCDPDQTACTLTKDFGATTLLAGEERDGQCHNWKLNNPSDLWVSAVELHNDGAYHHSNWFFVPERLYDEPDGIGDCSQLHFDELTAALVGGVLFAQSTQSRSETQSFPQGAVIHIPPYSRIVGSVHLLNAAPTPTSTGLRLSVYTVPPAQAKIKLVPFRLTYYDLHIPAQKTSQFGATCNLRSAYEAKLKRPLDFKLYYVLPHYHALGNLFRLELAGGARTGQVLYDLRQPIGEGHGQAFDPPVNLSDSDGFRFTCGFANPRPQAVGWGIGDQEMCEMLGFADSALSFDAGVDKGEGHSTGAQAGVELFDGDCHVIAIDAGG